MGLKKHFCSLKIHCAIFRGHFGNFGNLGGTNNTFGKLWGLKSNFGKGVCGLWTHRLGVFLIKVIGLGLRLLKWIGLCIELGFFPNRLDRPTSSISLISSYLLLIDMAKWVRIFWPSPNPLLFFTRIKIGLTHDPTCVFWGSTQPDPQSDSWPEQFFKTFFFLV